jgi:protein O-mannosyl-transferase
LGTILPVIGVVQFGLTPMADRFTYVPLIGLFVMVAWGIPDLLSGWRAHRGFLFAAALLIVIACAAAARAQVNYWRDNVTLFTRATEVTLRIDSYAAHMTLGATLRSQGRTDEAVRHFLEAVRLRPESWEAQEGLGVTLAAQGRTQEAIVSLSQAVNLAPASDVAHVNYGLALVRVGRSTEAAQEFGEALRINPNNEIARRAAGQLFRRDGK